MTGRVLKSKILSDIYSYMQKSGYRRVNYLETHVTNKERNGATHKVETKLRVLFFFGGIMCLAMFIKLYFPPIVTGSTIL